MNSVFSVGMNELFRIDTFATPEALVLLLFIPAYIVWYFTRYDQKRLRVKLSYDPADFQQKSSFVVWLRYLPFFLQIVAMSLLIVALARPQTATDIIQKDAEGIDIMLLLDTSGSMETEDFPPNRLEVAKKTAISFVEGRISDRIGLVLFAADAFNYVPLTLDYDLLKNMIEDINFKMIPKEGTAIGSAIAVGINHMRDSKTPSKVIVLLTDGANNRGQIDPITASKLAKRFNIKMYCIGVGKENKGNNSAHASHLVKSDLDETTLRKIADITGGRFFRSTDSQSLKEIFQQISEMERVEITNHVFRDITDHYPIFLGSSIVCFGLTFLLMLSFFYNPLEQ